MLIQKANRLRLRLFQAIGSSSRMNQWISPFAGQQASQFSRYLDRHLHLHRRPLPFRFPLIYFG